MHLTGLQMMQIAKQTSGLSTSELNQWMGIYDWLVRLELMSLEHTEEKSKKSWRRFFFTIVHTFRFF